MKIKRSLVFVPGDVNEQSINKQIALFQSFFNVTRPKGHTFQMALSNFSPVSKLKYYFSVLKKELDIVK